MITDLSLLYVEYIIFLLLSNNFCLSLLQNSFPCWTHNLFGVKLDSFTISIKALRTVYSFLSFKDLTHTYLVETSMTRDKYSTFLFFEDNDSIWAKSSDQILSCVCVYNHFQFCFLSKNL